jgi:hypothetical protein
VVTLSIKAGSQLYVGRPARPMPQQLSQAISELVAGTKGIQEAHLPQVFVKDTMEAPAQVLIVVIDPSAPRDQVLQGVAASLRRLLPKGAYLDIWPLDPSDETLLLVRQANCRILYRELKVTRPWWRFWT